jgi:hypothetical protein
LSSVRKCVLIRAPLVGRIAQLVEQRTENPCVAGSIPAPATTSFPFNRINAFVKQGIETCKSKANTRIVNLVANILGRFIIARAIPGKLNRQQQPLDFLEPGLGFLLGETREFAAELDEVAGTDQLQLVFLDFDARHVLFAGQDF